MVPMSSDFSEVQTQVRIGFTGPRRCAGVGRSPSTAPRGYCRGQFPAVHRRHDHGGEVMGTQYLPEGFQVGVVARLLREGLDGRLQVVGQDADAAPLCLVRRQPVTSRSRSLTSGGSGPVPKWVVCAKRP